MFQRRVVALPLAFYVLDKFAVPGAAHIAALLPVDDKFRDGILHKREADIGVFDQDFKGIFTRAPLAVHGGFQVALKEFGIAVATVALLFFPLLAGDLGLVIAPFVQQIF